jgi:AcrR family transcriptional regulator
MIDAAERLIAQRGLAAVSLRDVQLAAGQRNRSAAAYHFGSRHGLIEAVVTSRMALVSERRAELLAGIDDVGDQASLRDLVEALVLPIAEHTAARPDSHWARFLFQCSADPDVAEIVRRSVEGETYREVRRRLLTVLDHLPEPLRVRRIEHATGLAVMSLAGVEDRRDAGARPRLPVAAEIADLIDMCVAVLHEPASHTTRAALPRSRNRSR